MNYQTHLRSLYILFVAFLLLPPRIHGQTCVPAPSGLVGWWQAESNALDSADGNHGALVGNVAYAAGKVGQSFTFDGNGDAIFIGNPSSLQLQNLTIESWVKRSSSTQVSATSIYGEIVGYGSGGYVMGFRQDGYLFLSKNNVSAIWSAGTITDTAWHHVAVTKNGSTVVFYVDGVAEPAITYNTTFEFTTDLRIGAVNSAAETSFLGLIDELSIYNRALSTNEIQSIYNAGSAGKCPLPPPCAPAPSGLVSWWQAESNALDSANSNHGTLIGNATYAPGQVGQAFSFDGDGDAVFLGNSTSLQLQDLTIEAWIKRASTTQASLDAGGGLVFSYGIGGYGFGYSDDGYLFLTLLGTSHVASTPQINDTNFHHVAVTKTGSTVVFYIDGVAYPAPSYGPVFTFTTSAAVGARGDNYGNSFLGLIDELDLFNRALTSAEILAIYNAGSAGKCPPPPPPPPCVPSPSGLVSWWQAESNALDGADGNQGTLVGNAAYAAGRVGQAFSFDGNGDAIFIGNPPNLRLQNLTIEGWVKRSSSTQVSATSIFGEIVGYGSGGYLMGFRQDGYLFLSKNDVSAVWSAGTITDTAWHHVAVSKNGSTVVFYVDGVAEPAITYNTTFEFTTDLRIGAVNSGVEASFLGRIDELSIYSRALSAIEIQSIYAADSGGKCPPPPPPPCVPAPSGLVSWWQAESNAFDSADGNPGTLQNGAAFAAGKVGQAFSFDGVDDVVTVPDAPNLRFGPTSPMTVEMWVYRTSSNSVQHIIGKRASCTGDSTEGTFQLAFDDTGLGLGFGPPGGACACSGQNLPLNTWTHLAGTFDGTTLRLFINGQLAATTTGSLGPANTAPLKIGDSGSCGAFYGQAFAGLIDEVSIYNRALSTNEIQSIYTAGSGGKCPPPPPCAPAPSGLVGWWLAESNALDSADGNHGALVGNVAYAAGRVGQAFSFDGNGDAIFIGNPAGLQLQNLTIEGWVKRSSSTQASASSIYGEIVGYGSGGYLMGFRQDGYLFLSKNDVSAVWSAGTITDTAWHHVAVTKNGSTVVFYVDGVAEPAITYNTTFEFTTDLRIGAVNSGVEASFLGLIDEVSIYNRGLTAAEIQSIYNAGSSGKCNDSPSITLQPVSQTVTEGENATFMVTADGTPQLRYQWRSGVTNIVGQTNSSLTLNNVQFGSAGNYSVVVSNGFGSATSSNALLTVNRIPAANPQSITLDEDTPTPITVSGSDADGDSLTYTVVSGPTNGTLSGTPPNSNYTPNSDYFGPDGFRFKVNDGRVDSPVVLVSLNVLPVDDPPVANSQSVSLNEDTSLAITMTASDVEGDPLTYSIVSLPAHGTLSGTAPNLTYTPNTNYFGSDSFTFKVNDGHVDSAAVTVSINVLSVPDAPVAKATISPLAQFPGLTNPVVISLNNSNATLLLDGSLSTDVEIVSLQYTWSEGTNVIATGVMATNILEAGTHTITLVVSGGTEMGTDTVILEVIAPTQAVGTLMTVVDQAGLLLKHEKALLVSLKASGNSFEKGKLRRGIKRLSAFQNKVRVKVAPSNQALGDELINGAQVIIDAFNGS